MASYWPGAAYYGEFTTSRVDTGFDADADILPSATAIHNGTDDPGGFPLAVTHVTTGRYKISGTIPASYIVGDSIDILAKATVNGVTGSVIIDSFELGGRPVSGQSYP